MAHTETGTTHELYPMETLHLTSCNQGYKGVADGNTWGESENGSFLFGKAEEGAKRDRGR
jgi:hypothetical protein